MKIKEYQKDMKEKLSSSRYNHSIGVSYIAAAMAMKYSYDVENARIAGLLHDCGKWMSNDELLRYAENIGLELSIYESENPSLLHGKIGAHIAKDNYEINDAEILQAIQYHTTGHDSMTILDKIIFVADYIEPNRKDFYRLKKIQHMAFLDLDRAVLMILEDTLDFLRASDLVIDPVTEDTYNYYKEKFS